MAQHHEDEGRRTTYEVGYHLVPTLDDEARALRVKEIKELIASHGGEVLFEGEPVPIALAYTMRKPVGGGGRYVKYDHAFFGWVKFSASPEGASAIKEALRSFGDIIRFILIKTIPADFTPTPPKVVRERKPVKPKGVGAAGAAGEDEEVSEEELNKAVEELLGDDEEEDSEARAQ
ncbi:MAG: hypothetical protein KatS3mg100_058 [Candidatus Parcubacteria bacterium]|nr:MAG: hypothetical protein KatS3mg100_058 [Candidatus Parcubacteria bacterium]